MKMAKLIMIFFFLLLTTTVSAKLNLESSEKYIEEARIKARQGDLEAAAGMYLKALRLDDDNLIARKELANLLLESQLNEEQNNAAKTETLPINENILEAKRWYQAHDKSY